MAEYVNPPVNVVWGKETSLKIDGDLSLTQPSAVIRHLARSSGSANLYGQSDLEKTEVSTLKLRTCHLENNPFT